MKGPIHIFILVDNENKHQNLKSFIRLDFFLVFFSYIFTSFRSMPITDTYELMYIILGGGWSSHWNYFFLSLARRIPYLIIIFELSLNVVEVNLLRSDTLFFSCDYSIFILIWCLWNNSRCALYFIACYFSRKGCQVYGLVTPFFLLFPDHCNFSFLST